MSKSNRAPPYPAAQQKQQKQKKEMKIMRRKILSLSLVMLLLLPFTFMGTIATTGTINLLSDGTANGTEYNAYLLVDADGNLGPGFETLLATLTKADNATLYQNLDELEEYMATMSVAQLKDFAAKIQTFINAGSVTPATATMTSGTAAFTGLSAGYYLIFEDDTGDAGPFVAAVELAAGDTRNIHLKDEHPTIEKVASVNGSPNGPGPFTAAPNQEITFTVTTKVPVIAGYSGYIFTITDTMTSNLTFDDFTSLTVGPASTPTVIDSATIADWATVRADGSGFELTIPYTALQGYNAHDPITLVYTAILDGSTPPGATEENEVTLTYSNDPDQWDDPDTTGPEIVVITTDPAEITIYKTGNLSQDQAGLNGAEFSLYLTDTTGSPVDTKVTASGGMLTLTNVLPGNTYILMETTPPTNYKGLKVDSGGAAAKITIVVGADGVITEVTHDGAYGLLNDDLYGGSVTWTSGNHLDITNIFDRPLLPETGGIGRTIFTISGVLMMTGAGAAISFRKRFNGKKKSG
jgi:fimbrial isopeptide formation D2 family protein/LPXTG-motif cell wall-anchored protein